MWARKVGKPWRVTRKANSVVIQTTFALGLSGASREAIGAVDEWNWVMMDSQTSSRILFMEVRTQFKGEILKQGSRSKEGI